MKKGNNYWIDENNNKWGCNYYTKEQAEKNSKTLTNCSDCSDCRDCSDCSDCSYCSYCSYCNDCRNCRLKGERKMKENPIFGYKIVYLKKLLF